MYGRRTVNSELVQVNAVETQNATPSYALTPPKKSQRGLIIFLIVLFIIIVIAIIIYLIIRSRQKKTTPDNGTVTGAKCTANSDCLGNRVCQVGTGMCVNCLSDSNCSLPLGKCNPSGNTCVACLSNPDCSIANGGNGGTCINNVCCINTAPSNVAISYNPGFPYTITGSYTFVQSIVNATSITTVYKPGATPSDPDILIYTQPASSALGTIFIAGTELCGLRYPGDVVKVAVRISSPCGVTLISAHVGVTIPIPTIDVLSATVDGQYSCSLSDYKAKFTWTPVTCISTYDILITYTDTFFPGTKSASILNANLPTGKFDGTLASINFDPDDMINWGSGRIFRDPPYNNPAVNYKVQVRAKWPGNQSAYSDPFFIGISQTPNFTFGTPGCICTALSCLNPNLPKCYHGTCKTCLQSDIICQECTMDAQCGPGGTCTTFGGSLICCNPVAPIITNITPYFYNPYMILGTYIFQQTLRGPPNQTTAVYTITDLTNNNLLLTKRDTENLGVLTFFLNELTPPQIQSLGATATLRITLHIESPCGVSNSVDSINIPYIAS